MECDLGPCCTRGCVASATSPERIMVQNSAYGLTDGEILPATNPGWLADAIPDWVGFSWAKLVLLVGVRRAAALVWAGLGSPHCGTRRQVPAGAEAAVARYGHKVTPPVTTWRNLVSCRSHQPPSQLQPMVRR